MARRADRDFVFAKDVVHFSRQPGFDGRDFPPACGIFAAARLTTARDSLSFAPERGEHHLAPREGSRREPGECRLSGSTGGTDIPSPSSSPTITSIAPGRTRYRCHPRSQSSRPISWLTGMPRSSAISAEQNIPWIVRTGASAPGRGPWTAGSG